MNVNVKIKLGHPDAVLPQYQTADAAGMDIHCIEEVRMLPNHVEKVRTGLYVEIPRGFEIQVRPRSGLAARGITVANSPGTIDADYRGELCVLLRSGIGLDIAKGTRIAQIVLKEVPRIEWEVVKELNETERSTGGFGSTGY
jgi:dUTP pyrophosphatase